MYHTQHSLAQWQFDEMQFYITKVDGKDVVCSDVVVARYETPYLSALSSDEWFEQWVHSEEGIWCVLRSNKSVRTEVFDDMRTMARHMVVIARLSDTDVTFYNLKFK